MKSKVFILLLIAVVYRVDGQQGRECLNEFNSYLERIGNISAPSSNQIYELSYTQETKSYKGPEVSDYKMDLTVRMSNSKMILESGRLSIYADKADMFYIYHDQKMIQWVEGYDTLLQDRNPFNILNQQKNILLNCKVEGCSILDKDNRKLKVIRLKGNQKLREELKVDEIVISYDLGEDRIYKVDVGYIPEHTIHSQTTIYNKIDFNIRGRLMATAYNLVFTNKGVLQKQFRDYSLIDNKH